VHAEAAAVASESARLTPIAARSARDKDPRSITGHALAEATRATAIGAVPSAPGTASATGAAPTEPSHGVTLVTSVGPGCVVSTGTTLPVARVVVRSAPNVCVTG
jgi:hypothetical protein